MLASRLCSVGFRNLVSRPNLLTSSLRYQSGDARAGLGRFARRRATLKEQAMAPSQVRIKLEFHFYNNGLLHNQ